MNDMSVILRLKLNVIKNLDKGNKYMKKSLRFSALALAMTLSVGASFPVSAATTIAQEGQPATINNASYASSSHISNFTFSRVPFEFLNRSDQEWLTPAPAGYVYHFIKIDDNDTSYKGHPYELKVTGAVSNYALTGGYGNSEFDATFTVTANGQAYPACRLEGMVNSCTGSSPTLGWTTTRVYAILLPANCPDAVTLTLNPYAKDKSQSKDPRVWNADHTAYYVDMSSVMEAAAAGHYVNYNDELVFYVTGSPATSQPQSQQTWVSDARGWRVQNADGTYLTNQWHQSDSLWYYLGADGYMLTSTTTPDGYTVNADGVWVQ